MDTQVILFTVWAVVTVVFLALVYYRSRLTKHETDWIPLSDDSKEEQAIQAQKVIENKSHRLEIPIRALGIASALMLLFIMGFWFYHGIMTPPPVPK